MIHNKQGFTLIELLLSMTILSIVFLVFFGFFNQGLLFSERNEDKVTAINLAKETLQAVKNNHQEIPQAFFNGSGGKQLIMEETPKIRERIYSPGCECMELNNEIYYPVVYSIEGQDPEDHYELSPLKVVIYDSASLDEDSALATTYGYIEQPQGDD